MLILAGPIFSCRTSIPTEQPVALLRWTFNVRPATVGIGPREDGTGFYINPSISVNLPGIDRETGEKLVAAAHIVCPYSHALRTATEIPATLA